MKNRHLRIRARRRQDGAVIFVVTMILAVLGSVGIYALAAAAAEVRTSGNERQSTQTHYMANYGVVGVAHEITATMAQFYYGLMRSYPMPCTSVPTADIPTSYLTGQTQACRQLASTEIGQAWTAAGNQITIPYAGTTPYSSSVTTPGSFGPMPIIGNFTVELSEPTEYGTAARYAKDLGFCFIVMTATSYGSTEPSVTGAPMAVGIGAETQRARIVAGPVQCPR
jgi:Tfp pilus assembly protein PilX